MISVEEAIQIIQSKTNDFGTEEISLVDSTGRILREEIYADNDMPPFDRVAMDGIAINYAAYERNIREYKIDGMAAAGDPRKILSNDTTCFEIMTGSILPQNADTIVPYEWIGIENKLAVIVKEKVIKGQNIHRRGTDRKKGDLLIPAGRKISASEIGVFASIGKQKVIVSKLPKVIIISTGNELIEVDINPLPHQVRMSNVYQLQAALKQLNIEADKKHLQDDYDQIVKELKNHLSTYDVIIISGGISAGKYDYIPSALHALGVQKYFYKVNQKPGKPFWFGTHAEGCTVFGIPGNPVSSFLCYIRYIQPWIESCLKKERSPQVFAKLSENLSVKSGLTLFIPVQLQYNEHAELLALPMKGHGSGDLSNLADADAFIKLPAERNMFLRGEVFPVYQFRNEPLPA